MKIIYCVAAFCLVIAVCGCAAFTPVDVARPSNITLSEATNSIANSLADMKQTLDDRQTKLGVIVDQIEVDLNIAADASQGGSRDLKIDASKIAIAGLGPTAATANISGSETSTGHRANSIHLTFKNINTAPLNCVGVANFYNKAKEGGTVLKKTSTDGSDTGSDSSSSKDKPADKPKTGDQTDASKSANLVTPKNCGVVEQADAQPQVDTTPAPKPDTRRKLPPRPR